MPRQADAFLFQVHALRRRERHRLLLQGLVQGAFFGSAGGAVLAAAAGTVHLPLGAALAGLCAAALGAAAGILAGLLRRVETRRLLLRVDRALGSRELAGTAWEIACRGSGPGGLFDDAILHDAARLLASARPRDALGVPRLRLLPLIPVAAALVAAAAIFPFDLAALFLRGAASDRELAVLGGELEGLGRRIERSSREPGLERGLELARELARLGRDLQERTVEPAETLERVQGLRQKLAREYGLRLRRLPAGEARERIDGGGGAAGGSGDAEGEGRASPPGSSAAPQKPGDAGSAGAGTDQTGRDPSGHDQGKDLDDAMRKLDELQDRAGRGSPADAGSRGEGGGDGSRSEKPGEERHRGPSREGEGSGPGGGAEGAASTEPGDEPAPDRKGEPSRIAQGASGAPLKAESAAEGGGEAMKFLVRSLPGWSAARTPEDRALRDYRRQAESAIAGQEVPAELRAIVQDYFSAMGMALGAP